MKAGTLTVNCYYPSISPHVALELNPHCADFILYVRHVCSNTFQFMYMQYHLIL